MKQFIKENLFKIIFGLPVFFIVIGIIIINLNLSKYGILDYNILQIQSIYVGAVFVFLLTISIVIFGWFHDFDNIGGINIPYVILLTAMKVILITVSFYDIFIKSYQNYNVMDLFVIRPSISDKYVFFISTWIIISVLFFHEEIKTKRLLWFEKIYFYFFVPLGMILCILLYILLYYYETIFKDISSFFIHAGVFFVAIIYGIMKVQHIRDYSGIRIPSWLTMSLKMGFSLSAFLFVLLVLLFSYSNSIYQHIPKKWGGGKSEVVNVYRKNDVIKGMIIHERGEKIFLLDDCGFIRTLKWDEIEKIKK